MNPSELIYKNAMTKMEAKIDTLLKTQDKVSMKDFEEDGKSNYSISELAAAETILDFRRWDKL
jgi:hypothetical protein